MKRKAIADANTEKPKVVKERDETREALNLLEEQLGTVTGQYDSEDGTRTSRLKTTAVTRVLRSVTSKERDHRNTKSWTLMWRIRKVWPNDSRTSSQATCSTGWS